MIFLIARKAFHAKDIEWVNAHWQLAWKRSCLLLVSYALSIVIILLGWLLATLQTDHNMFTIMLVVFSRIAAVPIVLTVFVLLVMETTSLSQARQGAHCD